RRARESQPHHRDPVRSAPGRHRGGRRPGVRPGTDRPGARPAQSGRTGGGPGRPPGNHERPGPGDARPRVHHGRIRPSGGPEAGRALVTFTPHDTPSHRPRAPSGSVCPMTRAPGSYWSFWPNPHADFFGKASYEWNFLLKVDLPIVLGLLVLFSLPPVQAWTGCDVRILAVAFLSQFLFGAFVNLYGYDRISAGAREFGSHLTNVLAVVAIPLSTEKAMFALWALYPLIVWMDGYGSPKSVSSLLTSVSIPWLDPLWHRDAPTFESKLLLTGLSVGLGIVIYLVSSYFAAWA